MNVIRFLMTAFVFYSLPVFAHSFWLEPSEFSPADGSLVSFTLKVGEAFSGEEFVRHPAHLKTFELRTLDPKTPALEIPGRSGSSPAGYMRISGQQVYIATYTSEFSETALAPEKFRQYIEEEGLKAQVPLPKEGSTKEIKELFGRNAKALLVPVGANQAAIDRAAGMTLELVCECKSLAVSAGAKDLQLSWQLLFEGKPLADRTVFLENKEAGKILASAVSDKDGRVSFDVKEPGVYLVRSINILPADKPDFDWRSHWTSTIFAVTGAKK